MTLATERLFWIGCALRITVAVAALAIAPPSVELAFLRGLDVASGLPWGAFLQHRGDSGAFPYGLPALVVFWPAMVVTDAVGGELAPRAAVLAIVLAIDIVSLRLLWGLIARIDRSALLISYWLFPVFIYLSYWRGLLLALPAFGLVLTLHFLFRRQYPWASIAFGATIATLPVLALLLLLFGLYFFGRGRRRAMTVPMVGLAAAVAGAMIVPCLFDAGYGTMVLASPATLGPLTIALDTSAGQRIFLFPIVYTYLLLAAWRIQRLDIDLLWGLCGLTVTAGLILTAQSPVWTTLATPFLAVHAARSMRTGMGLWAALSALIVALHVACDGGWLDGHAQPPQLATSVFTTLIAVTSAALAIQMARRSIVRSSFHQAMSRPIAIGISGDSGSGKDTLVEGIVDMVGRSSAAHLSGDDYHLWDRHKPMWRALTHLDPRANDLPRFEQNVAKLIDRRYIEAPHYDHVTGRMTKPLRTDPAEYVLASGLHALWSPSLLSRYDISIFLDIDEDLRRFLKVRRDTTTRGHSIEKVIEALDKRAGDRARFITPQGTVADILLKLEPLRRETVQDFHRVEAPALRLVVAAKPGISFGRLTALLTAVCDVLAIETHDHAGRTKLRIEGNPSAADIAAAAQLLAPEVAEFIDLYPRWRPGLAGVMQLVVLTQIDRVRISRWNAT